jgi:uncharacterized membrane protein YhaH (DUF805 family)
VNLQGRANRAEYWWYVLFIALVAIVCGMLTIVSEGLGAFIYAIFLLATILPVLAVEVRRLHDTGKSGWWILLGFIPVVGAIVLIIFCIGESQPGSNAYGPNPKGA